MVERTKVQHWSKRAVLAGRRNSPYTPGGLQLVLVGRRADRDFHDRRPTGERDGWGPRRLTLSWDSILVMILVDELVSCGIRGLLLASFLLKMLL